jgi:trans-2,3-dihydro-3-hydroxyanthranilate isomerase
MLCAVRFFIADVFTERPFAGNQLAVFPDARGISDRAMQAIAREFNFPETTFVLPARAARHAAHVRIFTPKAELPFAGHPTIGTAAVLAHARSMELPGRLVLEEGIGPVAVDVARQGGTLRAEFEIENPVELTREQPAPAGVAAALSLAEDAVVDTWFAGAGVRFCFVKLADRAAVDRAVIDRTAWKHGFAHAWSSNFYLYAGDTELYVRMFAPALGVEEDPATGSGAVALAGVLAARRDEQEGSFNWRIEQGVAMGRPSRIEVTAEKRNGTVERIKVGGATVITAEGEMNLPAGY